MSTHCVMEPSTKPVPVDTGTCPPKTGSVSRLASMDPGSRPTHPQAHEQSQPAQEIQ